MIERIDDRLWQGALPPDLERLRARVAQLPLPPEPDWSAARAWHPRATSAARPYAWLALAASVLAILGAAWFGATAWRVEPLAGRPSLSGFAFVGRLATGGVVTTDPESRARIVMPRTGEVSVEPGSSVRRVRAEAADACIQLERGTVNASLGDTPRRLAVVTRAGTAVDLGGAFTITMADTGGRFEVTGGRAMFENGGVESYLPAGVWCALTPAGAGAPRRTDASDAFLAAVAVTDNPACQADDFTPLLEKAQASDAITLWHLLPRVQGRVRRQVAERFAALVAVPQDVALDRVLALEPAALAAWWNALGFGALHEWNSAAATGPQLRAGKPGG